MDCNFKAGGSILRTGVQIAVTATALGLGSQAWAFSTWVDTVSLPPGGPVLFEACHEGHMLPPTSYGGGWSCGSRTVTGSEPYISHADDYVFASADLRDGRLRLTANENGSARAGYGDWLQLSIPDLLPGDVTTITIDITVHGTYARAPGQDRGQANFGFNAYSGINSYGPIDTLITSVAWRTSSGSNAVNSTANPEEFHVFSTHGEWLQLGTDRFRGEIDIHGDDPSLGLVMALSAAGPADFGNSASISLVLPDGTTYVSDSGVFLTPVPEPASASLLALGLAGLIALRKRGHRAAP